jgi:BirA family biotin operon repressor/biotin-[acetyl-CoA-carboxylase] ligase
VSDAFSSQLFPGGQAEAARWAASLPAGAFGRPGLAYFPETGSTQDQAFAAARHGAAHGAAFVAEVQTAGRGRHGAEWLAPAGSSLLVSALLRPAPPPKDSGRVALAAALAACRAVESAVPGARVEIQWPNDLLLGGRKLGGILIESRRGAAALGLGLNVAQRPGDFPPELRDRATSLAAAGAAADRRALLAALLAELGRAFGSSGISEEAWGELRAEVEARLAWRGREVRVAGCPQGPLAGKLVGLDESGGLILESAGGARRAAATGSLELA